jgi:hypothetical protein
MNRVAWERLYRDLGIIPIEIERQDIDDELSMVTDEARTLANCARQSRHDHPPPRDDEKTKGPM